MQRIRNLNAPLRHGGHATVLAACLCTLISTSPAIAQGLVRSVTHPAGIMTVEVEDPAIITTWDGSVLRFWQRPGGRFRLLTGLTQPTGGDPTLAGDEGRAVASTQTTDLGPYDIPYATFSSKLTVAVGGDHETGNYHDLHVTAVNTDGDNAPVWDYWPVRPTAGSRDIYGVARFPLDDDDPNQATQFIEVQHRYTLIHDVLQIEHIVTNRAGTTLPVGIRIFIDGQFGGTLATDGSSIVLPTGRVISSEAVLPDAQTTAIPDTWVTVDRPNNPTVLLRGTIEGSEVRAPGMANESAGRPDEIGWGLTRNAGADLQWDFTPNSVLGLQGEDWGYFVKWKEKDLPAGRSRRYVTYFGMGASTADYDPPYALAAYGPTTLVAQPGDDPATPQTERYYLTDREGRSPFPVTVYADNFYPSPLLDASVRISLPAGLELDPETQPRSKSLGTLRRNDDKSVSWTLRATSARPGVAVVKFTGPLGKTVERKINIPAVPVLTPLPNAVQGLEMVSIPYTFSDTDAEHVFENLAPLHPGGAGYLLRYDPEIVDYRAFPEPFVTNVEPGLGYWLLNRNRVTVYLPSDAREVPTDQAYTVNVLAGWNQIGNPFTAPIYLADVRVIGGTGMEYSMREAVGRGLLLPALFSYNPETEEYEWQTELSQVRMDPYTGYWLLCHDDLTLQFPPPNLFLPSSAPRARLGATVNKPAGWRVPLVVAAGGLVRDRRCFGMAAGASDGLDSMDVPAPPPGPTRGASLRAEWIQPAGGERYMEDIRSASDRPTEWVLAVSTSAVDQPVTVSWPDISALPSNLVATLVDEATGERRYMRTATSYTFRAGTGTRTLRILVQPRQAAATLVTTASVSAGGGGASVVFTLSADANVDVEIMNISGVPIRRVVSGRLLGAGMNSLAWDGRNGQGAQVPSGRYLCRITARSPETGEQHSVVRAFQVGR